MSEIAESPWINIANPTDLKIGISRYAKTIHVPHPTSVGDVVKLEIEAVVRHRAGKPPEHCLSEELQAWLKS